MKPNESALTAGVITRADANASKGNDSIFIFLSRSRPLEQAPYPVPALSAWPRNPFLVFRNPTHIVAGRERTVQPALLFAGQGRGGKMPCSAMMKYTAK